MAFEGKCLTNASLTYGLILSIICGISSFISLGFMIYYWAMTFQDQSSASPYCFLAAVIFLLFGISTKYSVMLILGILCKQPTDIKKFLNFAFISNTLSLSITFTLIKAIPLRGFDVALALAPNFIFSLLNCMVYWTYTTLKEELKSEGEGVAGDVENNGGVADRKEILNLAVVPASKP